MIPKKIHFYWSGNTLSWMRYMTLFSFWKLNPDWTMKLYLEKNKHKTKEWSTPETQDYFNFCGENWFSKIYDIPRLEVIHTNQYNRFSPVQASDIFSWDILSTEGGFYSDMDILYIRPMKDMPDTICLADVVLSYIRNGAHAIGFMGSGGHNKLFQDAKQLALKMRESNKYQSAGNKVLAALHKQSKKWIKYKYIIHYLDPNTIYRWKDYEVSQIFSDHEKPPEPTIGIHWFGGHSISQKYNNLLNRNNFREYVNVFSKCCNEICELP